MSALRAARSYRYTRKLRETFWGDPARTEGPTPSGKIVTKLPSVCLRHAGRPARRQLTIGEITTSNCLLTDWPRLGGQFGLPLLDGD